MFIPITGVSAFAGLNLCRNQPEALTGIAKGPWTRPCLVVATNTEAMEKKRTCLHLSASVRVFASIVSANRGCSVRPEYAQGSKALETTSRRARKPS
jgi:hypothetical protein